MNNAAKARYQDIDYQCAEWVWVPGEGYHMHCDAEEDAEKIEELVESIGDNPIQRDGSFLWVADKSDAPSSEVSWREIT